MLLVALQILVAWLILSQLKRKIGFLHTLHRTSEQGFSEDKTMHIIDACRGADACSLSYIYIITLCCLQFNGYFANIY